MLLLLFVFCSSGWAACAVLSIQDFLHSHCMSSFEQSNRLDDRLHLELVRKPRKNKVIIVLVIILVISVFFFINSSKFVSHWDSNWCFWVFDNASNQDMQKLFEENVRSMPFLFQLLMIKIGSLLTRRCYFLMSLATPTGLAFLLLLEKPLPWRPSSQTGLLALLGDLLGRLQLFFLHPEIRVQVSDAFWKCWRVSASPILTPRVQVNIRQQKRMGVCISE